MNREPELLRDTGLWKEWLPYTNLDTLAMSWLQNKSSKRGMFCVRGEVLLLFPQEMKSSGFIQTNRDQIWLRETSSESWLQAWGRKTRKDYRRGNMHAGASAWEQLWDWLRHDKHHWLHRPHDFFLHATFLYGMDRCLVIAVQTDL